MAPAAYLQDFLEPKLEDLLGKKNRPLRSEDTMVVISVTERSEHNHMKRFNETSINYAQIHIPW